MFKNELSNIRNVTCEKEMMGKKGISLYASMEQPLMLL